MPEHPNALQLCTSSQRRRNPRGGAAIRPQGERLHQAIKTLHERVSGAKLATLVVVVLIAGAPLAVGVTLPLMPLWRWLEAAVQIEAVGHSGPASWCYLIVYATLIAAFWIISAVRNA